MKRIIFLSALFCASLYGFSQVDLEPYGSYINNTNGTFPAKTRGIGFRVALGRDDRWVTRYFGVAYSFPMSSQLNWEAQAIDTGTDPSSVDVTASYKQSMVRLEAGCKLYPVGRANKFTGVNWYFNLGLEGIYCSNKPTYSYYDETKYALGYAPDSGANPDGTDKYSLGLDFHIGSGVEVGLGRGNIFVQGMIAIPGLRQSSARAEGEYESVVPLPKNINVGYKIPLGLK